MRDSWEHEIVVEGIVPAEPNVRYPRCVDGRRASPPEDCGGAWGYAELLRSRSADGRECALVWALRPRRLAMTALVR